MSIIITTRDRPQYLREAMESVLRQSFSDLELIVVDDASRNPETEAIVRSIRDPRLRYIWNKVHLGSTKSLNVGLREAGGRYVAILDDDDAWISQEKLEKQVAFLESHPEYVCVGTGVVVVDADSGKELVRSWISGEDSLLRRQLFVANPFAHSSVLYRREAALRAGGYDERLPRGKDYDLWLKLAKQGKVAVLPDHLVKYREASPRERDLLTQRFEDAKWTLAVMKRHRKDFPSSTLPYLRQVIRYFTFRILRVVPSLYSAYRFLKERPQ